MSAERFDFSGLLAGRVPAGVGQRSGERPTYDFGTGYPDPNSFPATGLYEALGKALKERGRDLVLYPDPLGHPELREFIAEKVLRERGIAIDPAQILVTGGSGPAIALFVQLLVNPGDVVLTESYTYVGTLTIMRDLKARVVGIATDAEGMLPEALEQTIQALARFEVVPKMIYTIPSFQNPLGTDMGVRRRQAILAVAQRYGVPIYEDDAYEDLRFQGERAPAIHSYDESGLVLYSGTFSKILGPGLRVGFLAAPRQLMSSLTAMYWGRPTSELSTLAVLYYLRDHLDSHVAEICDVLRSRRDAMIAAVAESMGTAVTVSHPHGGLYVWLELPVGADTAAVAAEARRAGVAYLPGPSFSPSGAGMNCLRLCFGYETEDAIRAGISTLAEVFTQSGLLATGTEGAATAVRATTRTS